MNKLYTENIHFYMLLSSLKRADLRFGAPVQRFSGWYSGFVKIQNTKSSGWQVATWPIKTESYFLTRPNNEMALFLEGNPKRPRCRTTRFNKLFRVLAKKLRFANFGWKQEGVRHNIILMQLVISSILLLVYETSTECSARICTWLKWYKHF